MDNYELIFKESRKAYDKCCALILAVADEFKDELTERQRLWFAGKFDYLLQYSLLQIAVADSDLSNYELLFIREITKFSDILERINEDHNEFYEWDDFDADCAEEFLSDYSDDIEEIGNDFVSTVSLGAALANANGDNRIESRIQILAYTVILKFLEIDGNVMTTESYVIENVFDAIKKQTKKYMELIDAK